MEKIREMFSHFSDWEEKYVFIISKGRELPPLKEKDDKFLVKGCQSQVWLVPRFEEGKLYFEGDSDALISKGLLALLLSIFSGKTPAEILEIPHDFLSDLGILEHISMNRSNGLLSMLKQIKNYAVVYNSL